MTDSNKEEKKGADYYWGQTKEYAQYYEVVNSVLDIAGYYLGNMASHKILDTPKPKITDTIGFAVADIIIRASYNSKATKWVVESMPFSRRTARTETIVLLSFAINFIIDVVSDKSASKALINNLIKNGVALGTNFAIDAIVPMKYN